MKNEHIHLIRKFKQWKSDLQPKKKMIEGWDEHMDAFLIACSKFGVRMMMSIFGLNPVLRIFPNYKKP